MAIGTAFGRIAGTQAAHVALDQVTHSIEKSYS
jgi:hypothetical protein